MDGLSSGHEKTYKMTVSMGSPYCRVFHSMELPGILNNIFGRVPEDNEMVSLLDGMERDEFYHVFSRIYEEHCIRDNGEHGSRVTVKLSYNDNGNSAFFERTEQVNS